MEPTPTPQSAAKIPSISEGPQKPFPLNPILAVISFVSLLLSTFFIYQNYLLNQKLQLLIQLQETPTLTPTPTITPNLTPPPTEDTLTWKTYSLPKKDQFIEICSKEVK